MRCESCNFFTAVRGVTVTINGNEQQAGKCEVNPPMMIPMQSKLGGLQMIPQWPIVPVDCKCRFYKSKN